MKKIAVLSILLFGFVLGGHAQKLSKDEIAKYENEIKTMISYLEETMNFLVFSDEQRINTIFPKTECS